MTRRSTGLDYSSTSCDRSLSVHPAERGCSDVIQLFYSLLLCRVVGDAFQKRGEVPKQTGRGFRQQEVDDPVLPDVVVALENRDQVRRKRLSDRPEKRGQGMGDGPVEVLNPRKKLRNDRLDAGPTKCHGPICSIHIELVRGHDLAKIHVQKASGSACGYPQDRSRARCGMRVRL